MWHRRAEQVRFGIYAQANASRRVSVYMSQCGWRNTAVSWGRNWMFAVTIDENLESYWRN